MNLNTIYVFQVIVLWALCCNGSIVSKQRTQPDLQDDVFSKEVASLARTFKLPDDRMQAVPSVVQDIQRAIEKHWPGCKTLRFGSTATGVTLNSSDVDVFVRLNRTDIDTTTEAIVEEARAVLEQHPDLFNHFRTYTVPKVLVSVVTFKHTRTKFNVDMNFKNELASRNSLLIKYLLHIDERVLDLAIIVKYWARLHKVTAYGQCPSSGLTLLLIFYLQQIDMLPPVYLLQSNAEPYIVSGWNSGFDEIDYKPRCNRSMYELLGGFFEYYDNFIFEEYIVSVFLGHPVQRQLFDDDQIVSQVTDLCMQNDGHGCWTPPKSCGHVCIQEPFEHDRHYGNYDIPMTGPNSAFMTQFKRAAAKYRENKKSVFLDELLKIYK